MKFLNYNRVLCLSPHPDDVELSMTGTIKRFSDTIFDIACLSYGSSTDRSSTPERIDEIKSFWEILGCKNVNLVFPSFLFLDSVNQAQLTTYIENTVIGKKQYDAIFAPSYKDSHQEHRLINNVAMTLVRKNTISVIDYKTPSTLHEWSPNLFIDIDSYCAEKIKALRACFKTQLDAAYFNEDNLKLFHSNFIDNKKSSAFRESFKIRILYI